MESKGWIMLRILLNRYHQESGLENFLRGQPQELVQNVLSQDVHSNDPSLAFTRPEEVLSKIHYSWIAQAFGTIPQEMQPLMLSLLPEPQKELVGKSLNIPIKQKTLPPQLRSFLLYRFMPALKRDHVLIPEFLPKSPFRPLLELKKGEMVEVIDLLGIYDLAYEMRHIVDNKTIKNIYQNLTPNKQKFLRSVLHQKEKLQTPRLHLDKWNGDTKVLDNQLHQRGMLRLGKALSGQHPDLIWHIVHGMDTGRGKIIMRHLSTEEAAGITTILTQQVINVLNFIKPKSQP